MAPVLDINDNPKNPIINLRSYGDNPIVVSNYGLEFINGIQDNGLLACAKHFPVMAIQTRTVILRCQLSILIKNQLIKMSSFHLKMRLTVR